MTFGPWYLGDPLVLPHNIMILLMSILQWTTICDHVQIQCRNIVNVGNSRDDHYNDIGNEYYNNTINVYHQTFSNFEVTKGTCLLLILKESITI